MQVYEDAIIDIISTVSGIDKEMLPQFLGQPKETKFGDYAFGMFAIAKENNMNPMQAAQMLADGIQNHPAFTGHKLLSKVNAAGPYVNFFVNQKDFTERILTKIKSQNNEYGSQIPLVHYHYVLDYCAPNIAKPLHVGHLRGIDIGGTVKRILEFCGHRVVSWNYLGDWGTQFGKLIVAYKKYGSEEKLKADPIGHMLEVYVQFHKEEESNPQLIEDARLVFAQLEAGNEEYVKLWSQFRELSLAEFNKTFTMLNVDFEITKGESAYNTAMEAVVNELKEKKILKESDNCLIVDFKEHNISLPPAIIIKSNGGTTYLLRDLASAIDRIKTIGADFLLYETSSEQKMHFQQVFATLKLMGYDWADRCVHIDHGVMRFNNQKFATREGNVIYLNDVLSESINRVKAIIQEKNPELAATDKFEEVSRQIGISAVMFFDLSNDRIKDINFTWEKVLDFSGESGPYIQYTHARICSVLKKYDKKIPLRIDYSLLGTDNERRLCLHLNQFPTVVDAVVKSFKPHTLARYALDLAQLFSEYYAQQKIITENEELTAARIVLISCVRQTLENSLRLLGIDAPQEM